MPLYMNHSSGCAKMIASAVYCVIEFKTLSDLNEINLDQSFLKHSLFMQAGQSSYNFEAGL